MALIVSKTFRPTDFLEQDPNFFKIGFHLFHKFHLRKRFSIQNDTICKFLFAVKRASGSNWATAIDIACCLTRLLVASETIGAFKPTELLALLVAALSHQVAVDQQLIPLLAGQGVIETRVCERVTDILSKSECGIFGNLTPDDAAVVWELLADLLLSLDWTRHIDAVKGGVSPQWKATDVGRVVVLKLFLKAATFVNATRNREAAEQWADQILKRNSPVLDRAGIGTQRRDLFERVCQPLFTLLTHNFPRLSFEADDPVAP
jgi:hypothetical protein